MFVHCIVLPGMFNKFLGLKRCKGSVQKELGPDWDVSTLGTLAMFGKGFGPLYTLLLHNTGSLALTLPPRRDHIQNRTGSGSSWCI